MYSPVSQPDLPGDKPPHPHGGHRDLEKGKKNCYRSVEPAKWHRATVTEQW